jgi:hypothetical protein
MKKQYVPLEPKAKKSKKEIDLFCFSAPGENANTKGSPTGLLIVAGWRQDVLLRRQMTPVAVAGRSAFEAHRRKAVRTDPVGNAPHSVSKGRERE